MTDKELIQLYKMCNELETCEGCPERSDFDPCPIDRNCDLGDLIPRLGALLSENEAMKERVEVYKELKQTLERKCTAMKSVIDHLREATKMMPRWRPVSEPPKEYEDEYGEKKCFIVCVENDPEYPESFIGIYNGRCWGDGMFSFPVTHWMELPKPFSTGGMYE